MVVTPPRVSPSGTAAVALVYPSTAPQAAADLDAARTTSATTSSPRPRPAAACTSCRRRDRGAATTSPRSSRRSCALFIAVVVIVAFLLLMLVFRSLLIPAVASVMNLLSVGAALGIMNAVFEWGWGSSILGISRHRHRSRCSSR